MKIHIKKLIVFSVITVYLSMLISGCGVVTNNKMKATCSALLDAIAADNYNAAFDQMSSSEYSENDFKTVYDNIKNTLGDFDTYSLKQTGWNEHYQEGVRTTTVQYTMTTDKETFYIIAEMTNESDGLTSFQIVAESDAVLTGTITHIKGSSPIQLFLLFISGLIFIAEIILFIDCLRSKIKNKWIGIILILLLFIRFTSTNVDNSIKSDITGGSIFNYNHLEIFYDDSYELVLVIPFGSIIYLALRKRLIAQSEMPQTPNEVNNSETYNQTFYTVPTSLPSVEQPDESNEKNPYEPSSVDTTYIGDDNSGTDNENKQQ